MTSVACERGFSLLEVLVALAILGLGLTSILSAQAGLFASSARSVHVTSASNLARCKISEVEVKLLREGYQLTEQKGEGSCCEEEDESTYSCKWVIEPVILPEMNLSLNMDGGVSSSLGTADAGSFLGGFNPTDTKGISSANPLGPLGGLLPGLGGSNSPFGMLGSGSGSSAMGGLATMALSIIYPTLKPMLEASIRRITVSVKWREGSSERSFDVVEYVTNPMQGLPPLPSASSSSGTPGPLDFLMGLSGAGPPTSPMATPLGR